MRKILLCLLLILLMMPLSAHDIWDAFNDKITIAEYIDEYKELKQVQQFKKFKQDCKKVAMEYTCGIYDLVYYEPELLNVEAGYASYLIPNIFATLFLLPCFVVGMPVAFAFFLFALVTPNARFQLKLKSEIPLFFAIVYPLCIVFI